MEPAPGRRRPPNLHVVGPAEQRACSSCEHYTELRCGLYDWPVRPFHVCDSWAERSPAERTGKQQALDRLFDGGTTVVVKVPQEGGAGA